MLVPTIREMLVQYTNLVKKFVGKSLNGEEIIEMKELFLKNPEYMLVFRDEQEALQEAFTQTTKHIQQKFVKVLRDKLLEKGYNFSSLSSYESKYPEGFEFGTSCVCFLFQIIFL